MSSTLGDSITAALGGDQEPSDLAAAEVVAVVHHCIYCYTLWNTRASTTCAGPSEKIGTERYSGSRKRFSNLAPRKNQVIKKSDLAKFRYLLGKKLEIFETLFIVEELYSHSLGF